MPCSETLRGKSMVGGSVFVSRQDKVDCKLQLDIEIQCLKSKQYGLVRDLNPGPLAPKARIMPLDQRATHMMFTHETGCDQYHL